MSWNDIIADKPSPILSLILFPCKKLVKADIEDSQVCFFPLTIVLLKQKILQIAVRSQICYQLVWLWILVWVWISSRKKIWHKNKTFNVKFLDGVTKYQVNYRLMPKFFDFVFFQTLYTFLLTQINWKTLKKSLRVLNLFSFN